MRTITEVRESNLLSRDYYTFQENKELDTILTDVTKAVAEKMKSSILLFFRNKNIKRLTLNIGGTELIFKFNEGGVYFNKNETLTDTLMLFHAYQTSKNRDSFDENEVFTIQPMDLLMQVMDKTTFIAEFFKLASKRITLETIAERIIDEITLNLSYLKDDFSGVKIGSYTITNDQTVIELENFIEYDDLLKGVYNLKQLSMELVKNTGATEANEAAKIYVNDLVELMKEVEEEEMVALRVSFLEILKDQTISKFSKKAEDAKPRTTTAKVDFAKFTELSNVKNKEDAEKVMKFVAETLIKDNNFNNGEEFANAFFYVSEKCLGPEVTNVLERHLQELENLEEQKRVSKCESCESFKTCITLLVMKKKNEVTNKKLN